MQSLELHHPFCFVFVFFFLRCVCRLVFPTLQRTKFPLHALSQEIQKNMEKTLLRG